jgi:RNA polymerase sigma factor (sigma-70 family)
VTDDDIIRLLPRIRRIAAYLRSRIGPRVEFDDLVAVGSLAIVEAAPKYRADGGASWATYAERRIRGAMLDYMRALDPLSRVERERVAAGKAEPVFVISLDSGCDALKRPADEPSPDLVVLHFERLRLVTTAVEDLEPREREAITGYYLDEEGQAAIGQRWGLSHGRVSQILKGARAKVWERVKEAA